MTDSTVSAEPPHPIDVQLESGACFSFISADAAREEIEKERVFWQWLASIQDQHVQQRGSVVAKLFSRILSQVDAFKAATDSGGRDTARSHLVSFFQQLYGAQLLVKSDTPEAKYIEEIRAVDPAVAGWVLLGLTASDTGPSGPIGAAAAKGLAIATIFRLFGPALAGHAHAAAAEAARKSWEGFEGSARHQYVAFAAEYAGLLGQITAAKAKQETDFSETVATAATQLQEITETYDKKLALQAPVEYWLRKAASHRNRARAFAVAFGIGAVSAVGLFCLLFYWIHGFQAHSVFAEQTPISYWEAALLLGAASFLIWPLRMLARLLMTHAHLRSDAEERVTMTMTYLSLVREGAMAAEHTALILQALFRPSNAPGTDDGGPLHSSGMLSRIMSGDR